MKPLDVTIQMKAIEQCCIYYVVQGCYDFLVC